MTKLENQESVGEEAFVCGGGLPVGGFIAAVRDL